MTRTLAKGVDWQANLLYLEMHHTKTRKRRAVPLNHEARAALLNRARFRAEHCPASPWVFCDRDGQRIANVRRAFETACRRIGLADFGFTTYATLARHGW